MAEYVELYIDQGASFSTTIAINDDATNVPEDLSGVTVTAQMRKSLLSVNAYATFQCALSNAANGEFVVEMDSSNTANLKAGSYFYDVVLRNDVGIYTRLIEGVIFVTPGITR